MNVEASAEFGTFTLTIEEYSPIREAIKEENIPTEDPLLVTIQPGS